MTGRVWVAVGALAGAAVFAVVVAAGGGPHRRPAPAGVTTSTVARSNLAARTPLTVSRSGTPIQEQCDQRWAQSLAQGAGVAAAAALKVPPAAVGGGWPALAVADDPARWALTFVAGLLDVDFARQSRAALGGWIQAQEAPMLLPGLPAGAVDKTLFLSLEGGGRSPVVSASRWAANARAGVRQSVSDVRVQADPGWARLVGVGCQPPDARMAVEDVTGELTTTERGHVKVQSFGLQLWVGSGRWRDGYGSSAVADWAAS